MVMKNEVQALHAVAHLCTFPNFLAHMQPHQHKIVSMIIGLTAALHKFCSRLCRDLFWLSGPIILIMRLKI